MDLIDLIFSNISYIFLPISFYFFYVIYKRTYNEKESKLILSLMIYSILYIEFRFGTSFFKEMPVILLNIPLLIAMIKKQNINIYIISSILIYYSYSYFNNFFFLIILEYILLYLIYLKYNNNYYNVLLFMSFVIMIMTSIYMFYNTLNINFVFVTILEVVIFYLIGFLIVYAFKQGEVLFKMFLSAKEIREHKQVKNSLFKISHEIKNPIAVCKGYLDMFNIENHNHAQKYIPIIKEEIEKTLFLLEDFLSMNKVKINKDLLDMNYLLSNFISTYELYFKENNIDTNITLTDYEVYLNGDYNRLFQVLTNIVKNSIEALGENPHMDIWTDIKNDKFYIYFKDNGEGMPKDVLEKIKEPFFTTKMKGTGLGVSLSNEIIEAHGGKLLYESEMGKYTLVTIILPILEWY